MCESRTSTASCPQTALQVAVVVQNAYHEPPPGLRECQPGEAASQSTRASPGSPTAVQRLAKLSAGSLNPGVTQPSAKKSPHRRKKVNTSPLLGASHFFCMLEETLDMGSPQSAVPNTYAVTHRLHRVQAK